MALVKLNLDDRDDDDLQTFAQAHGAAMVNNPNYPTPTPSAAEYTAALNEYTEALIAANEASARAKETTRKKDMAREALCAMLTSRGNYVQQTSGGDAAQILTSTFAVRDEKTPIGALPAPIDFLPTPGDEPGEMDLVWGAVHGRNSYILEWREQSATTGPWISKVITKSKYSVTGLISGVMYVFRVAAVGSAGQSPWSLEAARRAP